VIPELGSENTSEWSTGAVIPEIVTRVNILIEVGANRNRMPQALPSPESLPLPFEVGSRFIIQGAARPVRFPSILDPDSFPLLKSGMALLAFQVADFTQDGWNQPLGFPQLFGAIRVQTCRYFRRKKAEV